MEREFRWSYDPRTEELDVWDSENGRIDHHRRHGQDGYENCSQGRIYPGVMQIIYSERPFLIDGKYADQVPDDLTKLHESAKLEVEKWMEDNKLPVKDWYFN